MFAARATFLNTFSCDTLRYIISHLLTSSSLSLSFFHLPVKSLHPVGWRHLRCACSNTSRIAQRLDVF